VGHLADHKGAADLVAAVPELLRRRPQAQVVLVGDGPLLARLQAQAGPALRVVGRVPHAEVPEYLAAADLLCLPSWDEGLPNVVREAHAAGRPVVASRVGGIPEAVHRPELGRLVEPRQPQALAQALAEQLAAAAVPPETIQALAGISTWSESAGQLHQLLVDVVRSGP
jgi:teichuronic acid biosynthesis glycosyltransferase TuaC